MSSGIKISNELLDRIEKALDEGWLDADMVYYDRGVGPEDLEGRNFIESVQKEIKDLRLKTRQNRD
jgi:hypothetical protein